MLSLTGYGVGSASLGASRLRAELRSVNHRFLDLKVRLPHVLADQAGQVDELLRDRLSRGRIELTVRIEGGGLGQGALDVDRARAAFVALTALRDELAPGEPVPLALLASVPELFTDAATAPDPEAAAAAVRGAVSDACASLEAMRAAEGAKLASDFEDRLTAMEALVERIRPATTRMVQAYRERLHARIQTLVEGKVALDPGRLEHEVALFADRADVTEELTRLGSHCAQFRALLRAPGAVGRKLEFLLQEMGREVNTTGAKVGELDVTHLVLELKAELERMREQVQNVL
jgi:uncharacterized protein (TIGR00255 family)